MSALSVAVAGAECIEEDTILAFLAGGLAGEPLERVERHLASCSVCLRVIRVAGEHLRSSASAPAQSGASRARVSGIESLAAAVDPEALFGSLRTVDDDEYVVERELARGGMGRILLALDRQGRHVAL